ncbi:MAG: acyltransferase [Bacteroidales bacterium]|nr:acyltransferase [Bacteroidales bacterium]
MKITDRQSQVIDYLKGILPIVVIVLHTSYALDLVADGGAESFVRLAIMRFGAMAVPTFFFISGFLFFGKLEENWDWKIYLDKCRKRIKSLLVPFILWIVIYLILKFLFLSLKSGFRDGVLASFLSYFRNNGGWRIFWDCKQDVVSTNIFGYGVPNRKPFLAPMWYIRDLMVCVLAAPLIRCFLKYCSAAGLFVLMLLYLLNIGLPFSGFSLAAFFFFSAGGWFRIRQKDFIGTFSKVGWPAFIVSVIALATSIFLDTSSLFFLPVQHTFVISTVIYIFPFADKLLQKGKIRVNRTLSEASFFVYTVHSVLILDFSNFILWRLLPFTNAPVCFIKVFLRPALATLICLSVFLIMRKFTPRTLSLLTGSRCGSTR